MFVLMLTVAAPVAAGDLISEPHALVYYQLPFSGKAPDTHSHFGLRMDRTLREAGQTLDYQELMLRPAVMDLRFNDSGMESLKFGGVDYLAQYQTLKADEEQKAEGTAAAAPEKATDKAKTEEKPKSEEDKLTIDKVMNSIPPGYFIGAGIGILLVVGVGG
jgi:hypothetical protein